ncbi:MAG: hypothetical protein ABJD53_02615 [Gammaproteobacteria bacterium]
MINFQRVALAVAFTCIGLASCGGDDHHRGPPISYTTEIQSDPSFDGDIALTLPNTFTVTQGMSATVQSVFAGIDPVSGDEYRSLLDFQLTGSSGVPGDAFIESAFLDIYINSLQTNVGTLPIRIDLVEFQPPNIIGTDYDRAAQPPLASILVSPDFAQSDVGTNVSIDVTSLMVKAQELGLVDFQVRILEDLGPAIPLLLEINDTTGSDRASLAPLLTVTYH